MGWSPKEWSSGRRRGACARDVRHRLGYGHSLPQERSDRTGSELVGQLLTDLMIRGPVAFLA